MAIFSKVKRAVKRAVNAVGRITGISAGVNLAKAVASGAKNIKSVGKVLSSASNRTGVKTSLTNAYQSTQPSNLRSGSSSSGPLQIFEVKSTPQGEVATDRQGRSYSFDSQSGVGSSPIYSAPVTLMGGESRYSPSSSTSFNTLSTQPFTPTSSPSISASSLSAPSAPISSPSAPTYANPGQINNGGLISALSDGYSYDPATNTFTSAVTQSTEPETETTKRNSLYERLFGMIPKKESVFEDKDILRQQEEVRAQQREVSTYTSQLNNIVAQQNADLLRLRGIGSQEGVTETVYGGQAAQINREAAIKALPVQAALSAAQGNLELAQDYLTQLTTWKTEQINNDYLYKKELYTSISDYVKGEDKRKLEELEKKNDRAYEEAKSNVERQDSWAKFAIDNGYPDIARRIATLTPTTSSFNSELLRLSGSIVPKSSGIDPRTGLPTKDLTAAQQTRLDAINTVYAQLDNYKQLVNQYTGKSGAQLTGVEAAQLRTAKSALEFAIASAVGTGALQAADRAVVQDLLPDPTSFKGALGGLVRGGKEGNLAALEEARKIFDSARNTISQGTASSISGGNADPLDIGTGANPLGI